ncbi:HNH endonuclease [Agromyces atrinae]|uniref:HNH endonuclease signature motif containing protein n=1 Tax=Agromyces atrinae TaxID=592376 RepID=UPI001F55E310|nr:HNH endonuclease signature motif containing protein [Agromyces atrinae]MCI2956574.1 HNH endonuclease [Agromyces atrinae]
MIDSTGGAGGVPEGADGAFDGAAGPRGVTISQAELLDMVMTDAEQFAFEANRVAARRLASIGRAIRMARENPNIYVLPELMSRAEARDWAVRAAATELSMRLLIPTSTVLNEAAEAHTLAARLPRLWLEFLDGATSYPIVRAAVETITGWDDDDAVARFDSELAGIAGRVTVASFRSRAKRLRDRLSAATMAERHRRALTERRVVFDDAPEGMMWLHALIPALDGVKIRARLNATAKRQSQLAGETRTRDQLRADQFADWLTGAGTATAVQTRVLVTVPLIAGLLEKPVRDARASAGSAGGGGANTDEPDSATPPATDTATPTASALPAHPWLDVATIDGYGPISTETARHIFDTATAFRRLIVDPITAEPLYLERTHYRPSQAQRDWLTLTYQRCSRPGCNSLAATSDVDHIHDWAHGGTTDIDNLAPLCPPEHRLKHVTLLRPEKTSEQRPEQPPESKKSADVRATLEHLLASSAPSVGSDSDRAAHDWADEKLTLDPNPPRRRWASPTGYISDTEPPPF